MNKKYTNYSMGFFVPALSDVYGLWEAKKLEHCNEWDILIKKKTAIGTSLAVLVAVAGCIVKNISSDAESLAKMMDGRFAIVDGEHIDDVILFFALHIAASYLARGMIAVHEYWKDPTLTKLDFAHFSLPGYILAGNAAISHLQQAKEVAEEAQGFTKEGIYILDKSTKSIKRLCHVGFQSIETFAEQWLLDKANKDTNPDDYIIFKYRKNKLIMIQSDKESSQESKQEEDTLFYSKHIVEGELNIHVIKDIIDRMCLKIDRILVLREKPKGADEHYRGAICLVNEINGINNTESVAAYWLVGNGWERHVVEPRHIEYLRVRFELKGWGAITGEDSFFPVVISKCPYAQLSWKQGLEFIKKMASDKLVKDLDSGLGSVTIR